MKIYTKTGDGGQTGLIGGTRVPKHHIRIESYGTVDELNAHLGLVRDQDINATYKATLMQIQTHLFTIGAWLSLDPEKRYLKDGKERLSLPKIGETEIVFLEEEIDKLNNELPEMRHFILPGGHPTVSFCHIARCVCRRAERATTALHELTPVNVEVIKYLNRLSDYLFVLARKLSQELNVQEIPWKHS